MPPPQLEVTFGGSSDTLVIGKLEEAGMGMAEPREGRQPTEPKQTCIYGN